MRTMRIISQDGAVDILYKNYSVIVLDHQLFAGEEYTVILAYDDTNPNIVYTMGAYRSKNEALDILEDLRNKNLDSEECDTICYFQFPKDSQSNIMPEAIMPPYIRRELWK